MKKIDQFFNPHGGLISIPARQSKKLAVLELISKSFEHGREYSEVEVNEILAVFNEDVAALRRYLIEFQLMERNNQSIYWLKTSSE